MKCFVVSKTGKQETIEINRKSLAKRFSIHPRDLRPVFTLRQLATISPKREAIVMNLGVLKLLVGIDKVYIFNTQNEEIETLFIPKLVEKLKQQDHPTPFEFIVLESALDYRFTKLKTQYEKLEKNVGNILKRIQKNFDDKTLERLLNIKKELSRFSTLMEEIEEILMDILDDDEEMKDFYLSTKVATEEDFEELESVLEHFSEPAEAISHKLEDLKENIEDTQEFISLKLSNRRNMIIRFDLFATLVTAVFSFLAVITGVYGMNIRNNIEQDYSAFLIVIGVLVFLGFTSLFLMWWHLKRRKIL